MGLDSSDTISVGYGADVLIGGKGDDKLYGNLDNDTYIFNLGDGNDTIEDYVASSTNSRADKVIFGDGISPRRISYSADKEVIS